MKKLTRTEMKNLIDGSYLCESDDGLTCKYCESARNVPVGNIFYKLL